MSDPRRASDDLLIQLLREGRHDSEVAVRLGITTGQLRERKTDLRNRLGAERYEHLTGMVQKRELPHRTKPFLMGTGIAAGSLAILLVIANVFAGEPEEETASRVVAPSTPTVPALTPPPQVTVEGRSYLDLGPFIVSGSSDPGPVGTVSNRLALAVIELRAVSYVVNSDFAPWALVSSSRTDAFLRGTVANRQIDVSLYTERPRGRLRTIDAGVGPLLEVDAERGQPLPAIVMLAVTEGGTPVEARLTPEGRLLIGLRPVPPERAVDAYNGSALDVSGAALFGKIDVSIGSNIRNSCDPAPPVPQPAVVKCRVAWLRTHRGFTVPFDGTFSCSGARSLRYEGGGVRLEFILVGQSNTSFACAPSEVFAGAVIVPDGEWVVAASSIESGLSLAVVVALNGQVYVGDVKSAAGCPCLPRPT